MSYQINVDAGALSHTAKKIKKSIQEQSPNNKSPIGHNEIINIITQTINNQEKNKSNLFPSSLNDDKILDLQDLESLNQRLKKSFKEYAEINDIGFISKIKREMISELFSCYHEMSLVDYLRNYNIINNRSFNGGVEIKTYTQVVDSLDSWVEDIYDRFKEVLVVKGTSIYPVFTAYNEVLDMSVFEINFFVKNKGEYLPNIINEALYAVMKNEGDLAKKILLKEIKNIYIQHQESTDEVLVDQIQKYHIHVPSQGDLEKIKKYKEISKDNFVYIGEEKPLINNKVDLIKSKLMIKKESLTFLPYSSPSKHTLLTGVYGMGAFSSLSSQLYQHIANDRGFIHFDYQLNQGIDTESTNISIEHLKSFIRKKGKGEKLNIINYRQLLKLKEADVIAFVNKNRMVYINLKVPTAMTKEELTETEQQLKMIVTAVSKANSVLDNRYLLNISSVSSYSKDFFNVMSYALPVCSEKGIIVSVFFHEHINQLSLAEKHSFFNLFHNYLIFKQSNTIDLLKDLNIKKDDYLAKEIESLAELSFMTFEDRERKKGVFSSKYKY